MKHILTFGFFTFAPAFFILAALLSMDIGGYERAMHARIAHEATMASQLAELQRDYEQTTDAALLQLKRDVIIRHFARYDRRKLPVQQQAFLRQLHHIELQGPRAIHYTSNSWTHGE